jgi:dolichol-phosphate mannosyltransferase
VAPVKLYTYTSIFRAYRKEVVENLHFQEDGFVSTTEILIRAAEKGYRIAEVPMTLRARKIGQTKMRILRTICGHLRLIGAIAFNRARPVANASMGARLPESKPASSCNLQS